MYGLHTSPYTTIPPHQLYPFISMTSTHTYCCAVTHTRHPGPWVIHLRIRIHRLCLYDCSNLKSFDLWHLWHIVLVLCIWLNVYFHFWMIVWMWRARRSNHSHLSMIAHMSRLTFSKAPVVPFSTACKSAGWSSTKIACMQPWKERWEGGNSVWRKYPESNKKKK